MINIAHDCVCLYLSMCWCRGCFDVRNFTTCGSGWSESTGVRWKYDRTTHRTEARKRASESSMISILARERLLGAALGGALAGAVVLEERKRIYRSISDDRSRLAAQAQKSELIFGKEFRSELAHLWNKSVDRTLGPVIEYLSSRGW